MVGAVSSSIPASESLKWTTQTELERDVVCSCSEDPAQAVLLTELGPTDFTDPAARAIHKTVLALAARDNLNMTLVNKHLVDAGHAEFAATYLNHMGTSNALNSPLGWIKMWVRELHESSLRRKLKLVARQIDQMADNVDLKPADFHGRIPQILTQALAKCIPHEAEVEKTNFENLAIYMVEHEAYSLGMANTATPTLMTDMPKVNEGTDGASVGETIVLAAASSMGKSALALQFLRSWAKQGDVYKWSGEMTKAAIARRAIAQATCQPLRSIRSALAYQAAEEHAQRLWVDDERDMTVERLCQKLAIFKLTHPNLVGVGIDYLGLLAGNDYKDVSAASRRIKRAAGELGVPILLLCQLKRGIEDRPDKRPLMSDLRESGQIEQDADKILMLYRPGYYNPKADQTEAFLYVRKFRDGERNKTIRLRWDGPTVSFFEAEPKPRKERETSFQPDLVTMEDWEF
jgi:replicative DNA helicase